MTIPFRKLKDEWMKEPAFRAEYEKLKPEFALALALLKARAKAGMTQADVRGRCAPRNRWSRGSKAGAIRRT